MTTGGITIATMTDYSAVYTDANTANRAATRSAKAGTADAAAGHRTRAKACVDARAAFKAANIELFATRRAARLDRAQMLSARIGADSAALALLVQQADDDCD